MWWRMNRIESVCFFCILQIKQLEEREARLNLEIEDGRIQMAYLRLLIDEVKKINVLNYLDADKSIYDITGINYEKSKDKGE